MANRCIIIYQGKTGFTKKYAEIIRDKAGCEMLPLKEANAQLLSRYDTVVFGGRVYGGKIDGFDKFKQMLAKCGQKRLVLFVTGATPCSAGDVIDEFWGNNLSRQERETLPHYYCQGGLNYERMPLIDKTLMKLFAAMMKRKKDKTEVERAFASAIAQSYDISSEEYAAPIVALLKTTA